MRGFIDILYRPPAGQLVIGDYKTDREKDDTRYATQAVAYTEAVSRALGEKAVFKTIYVRDFDPPPAPISKRTPFMTPER